MPKAGEALEPETPETPVVEPETPEAPSDITRQGVDLADLEEDGDGQPQTPEADRKGRRQERRELKQALAEERRQRTELEGRLRAIETRTSQPQQPVYVPQQAAPAVDPVQGELDGLQETQNAITLALSSNAKLSDQQVANLQSQWHRLERQKQQVLVDARIREMGVSPQSQDPQQAERQLLQSEWPEVYADPVARTMAQARAIEIKGQRPSLTWFAAAREACKRVASERGLRQEAPPAPTNGQKAKLSAVPSRGGQGGGNHYTPTKQEMSAARAYTQHLPDLDDTARFRKWAKDVGVPAGLIKRG